MLSRYAFIRIYKFSHTRRRNKNYTDSDDQKGARSACLRGFNVVLFCLFFSFLDRHLDFDYFYPAVQDRERRRKERVEYYKGLEGYKLRKEKVYVV